MLVMSPYAATGSPNQAWLDAKPGFFISGAATYYQKVS